MRRRDIQLLAAARQGNVEARCEIGRRYLLGCDGFPRHLQTALGYLTHPSVQGSAQAAQVIADNMKLEDIVSLRQEAALRRAAAAGSACAELKLATWLLVRYGVSGECETRFQAAANLGNQVAREALATFFIHGEDGTAAHVLTVVCTQIASDAHGLLLIAAREALASDDIFNLARCLRTAIGLCAPPTLELTDLTIAAVHLAEMRNQPLEGIPSSWIQPCLERGCDSGKLIANYVFGRALCGIACGPLASRSLTNRMNVRKGSAMLLRAADGGFDEAWLHLYRVHSDNRSSVANPQMARFFLEKAASRGYAEAQRKLGALLLRKSDSLMGFEQAIHWLFQAAAAGDAIAAQLLASLVLPLPGMDADAREAIENLNRHDPWLAMRLQLSRDFGLTKLEALTVNPADGARRWGLVVGQNPFIVQARLSAPRAVPALSRVALDNLQRAASMYEQAQREAGAIEGDLRRRSQTQRRAFERHHLEESMFFVKVPSSRLDALRHGPKWAFRSRRMLQMALAA